MTTLDAIAAALEGYDPKSLKVDQAQAFLNQMAASEKPLGVQLLPLTEGFDRILASDVLAPIDVPGCDNSAMDGFAFDASEHDPSSPLTLLVVGKSLAGHPWQGVIEHGQCVQITTGAVMPDGSNTVIPSEHVADNGSFVTIPAHRWVLGDNRRLRGEDIQKGTVILQSGQRLNPAAMGLVASLGLATVLVRERLKVAYFSTGNEILTLGQPNQQGCVYDSNRFTVLGMLMRLGCECIDLGLVADDPVALQSAFQAAASQAHVVITSGGVSVGEADHTKALMRQLGDVVFWRIAMRPGRPMAVGRLEQSLMFGLPGNPVAVMVTFMALVKPALLKRMGCTEHPPLLVKARSTENIYKKSGRTEYQRGVVSHDSNGALQVKTTGHQGSGVLSSMVKGNVLVVLHHDQESVRMGDVVDVMMFDAFL